MIKFSSGSLVAKELKVSPLYHSVFPDKVCVTDCTHMWVCMG